MLLPPRTTAALACIAALLLGIHLAAQALREQGRQQCQASYAETEREARAEVDRLAARGRQRQQENLNAYQSNLEREKRLAADTRRELDRVRLAAALAAGGGASAAAPAASGAPAGASELGRLLAEGAELVAEGRDRLGGLVAQVTLLQTEIRACTAPP